MPRKPHPKFSPSIVPGFAGPSGRAKRTEDRKFPKTSHVAKKLREADRAEFKANAPPNRSTRRRQARHDEPCIRFYYPSDWRCSLPGGGSATYRAMCVYMAKKLELLDSKGHGSEHLYLVFSAMFAAKNPELWNSFSESNPGAGREDNPTKKAAQRLKAVIWDELNRALFSIASAKHVRREKFLRSVPVWLFQKLTFLDNPDRPKDRKAARFFRRFTSGLNLRHARELPDFERFKGIYWKGTRNVAWESDGEYVGEMWMEYPNFLRWWHDRRSHLLRYPGLPRLARVRRPALDPVKSDNPSSGERGIQHAKAKSKKALSDHKSVRRSGFSKSLRGTVMD